MTALLCETVTGRTTVELLAARDRVRDADMAELRLDGVADPDVARALQGRRLPVIVTCRPTWEGGRFDAGEDARRRLLEDALAHGADYVDVEWAARFDDLIERHAARVIVSCHDFTGVPGDLDERTRAMRRSGAAFVKVAVTARRLSDTLPLREIAAGGPAIVIGMGDAGLPTRLLAARFGSRWTYGGDGVAPGQIPVARMVHDYRFRRIGPRTAIYGVVGPDVVRSAVPRALNAAFEAEGRDAAAVPLPGADERDVRMFADAIGIERLIDTTKDTDAHHVI